jgi:general nucleoside transport system ATP-binding protein
MSFPYHRHRLPYPYWGDRTGLPTQVKVMKVELNGICKYFGPVTANEDISFTVHPGSIHGILGENGAGKSTLMKILSGYLTKNRGQIFLDGRSVDLSTPAEAAGAGIGMLYQDPMDFPALSALDNFMLGQTSGGRLNRPAHETRFRGLAEDFGFQLPPSIPVARMTIGERQQLEILRLLSIGIRVLILDEPTTGISEIQKKQLFSALKKLTGEGKSVLLVSHKIEDVAALCHRVSVLRQGRLAGEMERPFETTSLLSMMFGTPPPPPTRCRVPLGKPALELKTVSASGGRSGLSPCTFGVRHGEIVGLAGLEGSGQGVLLRVAAGLTPPAAGSIHIDDMDLTGHGPKAFQNRQVAFLPTDRLEEGLIRGLSIAEHCHLNRKAPGLFIHWPSAADQAMEQIRTFRIKGSPGTLAENLSGGNQQRLLLSFLPKAPSLLLLENPTRGLDLESAHWVWTYLNGLREKGTGIVFSSSELDEILMVADRVVVFFDGRIVMDIEACNTDTRSLGLAIAGGA